MPMKIHLVVIDPQNSFCKVVDAAMQQVLHNGELCVPGAWEDMERVAALVGRLTDKLDDIHVTMDSHHEVHIAHPIWFRKSDGTRPGPFTLMREQGGVIIGSQIDMQTGTPFDVGEFTTSIPSELTWTLDYLKALATGKRYPHCIWPPHCLIGTPGHSVVQPLRDQLSAWCEKHYAIIDYVTKGSNYHVEHFSGVRAEVTDPNDDTTGLNTGFINTVMEADEILLAGEASSHCLANTVRDMANSFKDDSFIQKCVLLTDGTSPVPGFEKFETDFINEMVPRGMRTTTCAEYLA